MEPTIHSALEKINEGLKTFDEETPKREAIHESVVTIIGQFDVISKKIASEKDVKEFEESKSALSDSVSKVKKIMRSDKISEADKTKLSKSVNDVDSFLGAVKNLPEEVLVQILGHLDVQDLASATLVSTRFARGAREAGKGQRLQNIFESKIPDDFEFDQGDFIDSFELRTNEWKENNLGEMATKHRFALDNADSLDFEKFKIDEEILEFIKTNCPKIKSLTNITNYEQSDFVEHLPTGLRTLGIELRDDIELNKQDIVKIFAQSPHLETLHLMNIQVDEELISKLSEFKNLTSLGLIGTGMGLNDDANYLDILKGMTHLRELYILNSGFSDEQIEELKAALPETKVITEEAVEYESDFEESEMDEL